MVLVSKRARRLWLGDWQRDDPDQIDTFVVTPEDEPDVDVKSAEQRRNVRLGLAALAGLALLFGLGVALSSGGGSDTPLVSQQPQPQFPQNPVPQGAPPQGFGGPDLTGAEATKAAQAALQKYPGDIERVTRGPNGGGYVVHVIQPDGNEVHVLVDGQFHVQGSDANSGPRGFGSGTNQ